MAATTSTTTTCSGFFNVRSSTSPKVRGSTSPGCGKLDGVAMWFINGVASAFFASLERCSCIGIATVEDVDEANDAPLILNDGNYMRHQGGTSRRSGKGSKKSVTTDNVGTFYDDDY